MQCGPEGANLVGDDPNWPFFYVWKVARHCNGEPYCMEARVNDDPARPFSDIYGTPYPCPLYDWHTEPPVPLGPFDLNKTEMFFFWRAYLELATKVGPDDNELFCDWAIYFGPVFQPAVALPEIPRPAADALSSRGRGAGGSVPSTPEDSSGRTRSRRGS